MRVAEIVFWISVVAVLYPYVVYPFALLVLGRIVRHAEVARDEDLPSLSMIIPVHNEAKRIERKLANTAALEYPRGRLQVIFVSDGSTDATVDLLTKRAPASIEIAALPERRGKAGALNAGLSRAAHDIVVFSDASIELESDALMKIVRPFRDPNIGCVSGEDPVVGSGGEAWYGAFELMLRRLESGVHSIVGASGSFYAQRRTLCGPFLEGHAPDFLSVLRTIDEGFRAVSAPDAVGKMTSASDPRQEFERKARTFLRGMTTLFAHPAVLNPFRVGLFAFEVFSHKVMRWVAPLFLLLALVSPLMLLDSTFYQLVFVAEAALYLCTITALARWTPANRWLPVKAALYFSTVNAAVVAAWYRYGAGIRQEIWTPTRR